MGTCREQIEHIKALGTRSRKWLKKQMNRYIRRQKINNDSYHKFKRPTKGWEI